MALIPIGFKADSETNARKGKIRAEDYAALTAFSLPRKTGVLDLLNKINYDGITINSGVATITLHSGYAVICGRPVKVEEGTTHDVVLPSSAENGYFGIRVDLGASADNECTFFAKTGALQQDDLNENPLDGIYELALYTYTATGSTFVITGSVADLIKNTTISEAALYTADSNGTIDQSKTIDEKLNELDARLTTLGFKEGVPLSAQGSVTLESTMCKKIGKFVIGRVVLTLNNFDSTGIMRPILFYLPFSAKGLTQGRFGVYNSNLNRHYSVLGYIEDSWFYIEHLSETISGNMQIVFGYETDEEEEEEE